MLVPSMVRPSDRWSVEILERSTGIYVLCIGPICFPVSFAFILQPMGHLQMFQTLTAHRACPLIPTCSQSLPACHRSDGATVSSPNPCRDHYRRPCNPQILHLCPQCPYMALRQSKLLPTFVGPQNLTILSLAPLSHSESPVAKPTPDGLWPCPYVAPAPMFPVCLGPSSCVQLWLLPCLPTSLSQMPILTHGFLGLPTSQKLGTGSFFAVWMVVLTLEDLASSSGSQKWC